MKVLTLLLGHEVDGQIDQVLNLAELYDKEGSAFRFRYVFDALVAVWKLMRSLVYADIDGLPVTKANTNRLLIPLSSSGETLRLPYRTPNLFR